ncbi:MAG: hypothetical protein ABJG15_19490 [Hyphomonadaceae bacterium]
MFLRTMNIVMGLLFLLMGAVTFISPAIFTSLYGLGLPTPESRVAIRAIIGGGELSLSFIFLFGNRFGFSDVIRIRLALVTFAGVILFRLGAIAMEGTYSVSLLRELLIEIIILSVLGLLARKQR